MQIDLCKSAIRVFKSHVRDLSQQPAFPEETEKGPEPPRLPRQSLNKWLNQQTIDTADRAARLSSAVRLKLGQHLFGCISTIRWGDCLRRKQLRPDIRGRTHRNRCRSPD